MNLLFISGILLLSSLTTPFQEIPAGQEKPACPMHQKDKGSAENNHHEGVVERGDRQMGFSHERTLHHFRLYMDGGEIEAEVTDAHDTANRDAIRSHFSHIATMFRAGDFSTPMLIHGLNPPGTSEMNRLREHIQYVVEDTEQGARILITTSDPNALRAVYEFLRFQIADHQTGDPSTPLKRQ
jgi:hypothetical protein